MPKPWRSPLGEACGPSSPAACITGCTARQPVMRDQSQRCPPRPLSRQAWRFAVHQVERFEQGRGDGHGAIDLETAAALQADQVVVENGPVDGNGRLFGLPLLGRLTGIGQSGESQSDQVWESIRFDWILGCVCRHDPCGQFEHVGHFALVFRIKIRHTHDQTIQRAERQPPRVSGQPGLKWFYQQRQNQTYANPPEPVNQDRTDECHSRPATRYR